VWLRSDSRTRTSWSTSTANCGASSPITIVDAETAHAIPTERLAYGQRVAVVACSAPPILTTPHALDVVGPRCFGLDEDYVPVRDLIGECA
jgi:DUF917 family protein